MSYRYFEVFCCQDTCSGAIRVLEGLSVAHLLLSYGTQAQWAWLLLNVVSSALVIGSVLGTSPLKFQTFHGHGI